MTADSFDETVTQARAITEAILFLLAFIIVTAIFAYYIYVFRNELRKSQDQLAKALSWMTFLSILFFWITSFFSMYTHNFSKSTCRVMQVSLQVEYVIAKYLFWIVLALRLYQCYPSKKGAAKFRPQGRTIFSVMIIISLFVLVAVILVLIAYIPFTDEDVYRVGDDKPDAYPFYCDTGLEDADFDLWMTGIAS